MSRTREAACAGVWPCALCFPLYLFTFPAKSYSDHCVRQMNLLLE